MGRMESLHKGQGDPFSAERIYMLSKLLLREESWSAGSSPSPRLGQQYISLYYTYFFTFILYFILIPLQLQDYIGVL